jgi:hypothetical protein
MRRATLVFSGSLIALGFAILIRTAFAGGEGLAFGYIFGVGLIGAGAARLYLASSRSGP